MPQIGSAHVSTGEQTLDPRLVELREAGCTLIHEEQASGANRAPSALARLLARSRVGDTLVVVRLDRLARSLVHLLRVADLLHRPGAHISGLWAIRSIPPPCRARLRCG
jgi:DNA invertase Pin-like site-specific DNA recombinase